jgi:hypothetical protein
MPLSPSLPCLLLLIVLTLPNMLRVVRLQGFSTELNDARVSPDRRWLACVGDEDALYLARLLPLTASPPSFAVSEGERYRVPLGPCPRVPSHPPCRRSLIPDGAAAVVRVENLSRTAPLAPVGARVTVQYLAWNASSRLVACSALDAVTLAVVDVETRTVLRHLVLGGTTRPGTLSPRSVAAPPTDTRECMYVCVCVCWGGGGGVNGVGSANPGGRVLAGGR